MAAPAAVLASVGRAEVAVFSMGLVKVAVASIQQLRPHPIVVAMPNVISAVPLAQTVVAVAVARF